MVKAPEPVIVPLKVVSVSEPLAWSSPVVRVAEPKLMVPAPATDPTMSDTLFRSNVPVTVTAERSGTEPEPLSFRVPAEIVVVLV